MRRKEGRKKKVIEKIWVKLSKITKKNKKRTIDGVKYLLPET